MGTAFAERLLDAGYPLVVSNRTPAKAEALAARGASVVSSPARLAEQADVILTSLADDEECTPSLPRCASWSGCDR